MAGQWVDTESRNKRVKPGRKDTQEQIDFCLSCKMASCVNCLVKCKVGQLPGEDPCLVCRSKRYCRDGVCPAKRRYLEFMEEERKRLDFRTPTDQEFKKFIHAGDEVYVLTCRGKKPRKVLIVGNGKFTTVDDDYLFSEHKKLWWFTE